MQKSFLSTARTELYPFTDKDLSLLMDLDSDPEVMTFLTGGRPSTEQECTEGLKRILALYEKHQGLFGIWKVMEKKSGEFMGWYLFRPCKSDPENVNEIEIGYRLKKKFWGRGLATELSQRFIALGFTVYMVDVIWAKTLLMNLGSQNVMKKVGLKFEREFQEELFEGSDKRAVRYALERSAWKGD